jgi:G6PDH family F420-dependent oxidoreductase
MVAFGYILMTEQRGPRELVSDAVAAEQAGFDFEAISDHYFPWLDAQGHAPNAWAVLGAVATATQRVPLMTYVTCPTVRYHPAVLRARPRGALVQIGGQTQADFPSVAAHELLPALREEYGKSDDAVVRPR